MAIKRGLGRKDFKVDARLLRRGLLDNGYGELRKYCRRSHIIMGGKVCRRFTRYFDRVLVAQAAVEGITLLTTDSLVAPLGAIGIVY